jgi:S-adenosylmethionine:tRNA ribosyltransferase-isomerase
MIKREAPELVWLTAGRRGSAVEILSYEYARFADRMEIPVNLSEFHYDLPEELIAQEPPTERDGARMLVVDRASGTWEDRTFREFPRYVGQGDCVVLNDSRVLPSRLFGHKPGREGRLQVFLIKQVAGDGSEWRALVRPGKKLRVGDTIQFDGGLEATVTEWGEMGERTIRFAEGEDLFERLEAIGHIPLPPYIHREDRPEDRERYQTVYARERGSVAAPTAGLHFTEAVLGEVRSAGAEIARTTLHVGLGTFQPIHAERIEDHKMHTETYRMDPGEWQKVEAGRRTVAIGTTSVRTLETIARTGELAGETGIYLYPGCEFRRVGAMLTNFHLPETSLMLLVCAFAGTELALKAYRHAVEKKYRFFSYGDCMLIL